MAGVLDCTHADFGRMRLNQFLPGSEVVHVNGWEYLGLEWVGEATSGFTEWLRLESDPEILRSIALNLQALPGEVVARVLGAIRLPVRLGMTIEDIVAVLGPPGGEQRFVPDRTTYQFLVDGVAAYAVGCTVQREQGLIYLTVHTEPLPT